MFLAGRPPLGQMPFLVTPERKILAQSGAIMKYICKKSGIKKLMCVVELCLNKRAERAGCIQSAMFWFVPLTVQLVPVRVKF